MIGANIHDQDILIADRSIEPNNDKIVIAVVDGNITVKRLRIYIRRGQVRNFK